MKWNASFDSAVLLALVTALLYSSGLAYQQGFLMEIGLGRTMLESSFYQIIYSGFLNNIAGLFAFSFSVFIFSVLFYSTVRNDTKEIIQFLKKLYFRIVRKPFQAQDNDNKKSTIKFVIYQSCIFTLLIVSCLLVLSSIEKRGKERAKSFLNYHQENLDSSDGMISVSFNGEDKKLRLIMCGVSDCAGIEGKTNNIYFFSKSAGYVLLGGKNIKSPGLLEDREDENKS